MFKILLLYCISHEFLLCAFWADDVFSVGDETLADHAGLAGAASEAIVVPMPALEGDESGAANTSDGFAAGCAALGEQLPEAVGAVRLVVPGGEPLAGQRFLAVGACEALSVPRLVAVRHAALGYHLVTLDALGGELVLIALGAVNIVFFRDETFGSDRIFAGATHEAFLVPLTGLVLHLLHACPEDIPAAVAPGCELRVVAGATVDPVCLAAELLVHQRRAALGAEEARFVPVLLFVREILRVNADDLAALVAVVGEDVLIALDAVGMVISEHVAVAGQAIVAMVAEHHFVLDLTITVETL